MNKNVIEYKIVKVYKNKERITRDYIERNHIKNRDMYIKIDLLTNEIV